MTVTTKPAIGASGACRFTWQLPILNGTPGAMGRPRVSTGFRLRARRAISKMRSSGMGSSARSSKFQPSPNRSVTCPTGKSGGNSFTHSTREHRSPEWPFRSAAQRRSAEEIPPNFTTFHLGARSNGMLERQRWLCGSRLGVAPRGGVRRGVPGTSANHSCSAGDRADRGRRRSLRPRVARCPADRAVVGDEPRGQRPPKVRNVGRIAYDDRYLYVALEFDDPEPKKIRAPFADRDNVDSTTDYGGIILDPDNDRKTAILFLANPRGIQYDAINSERTTTRTTRPTGSGTPRRRSTTTAGRSRSASRSPRCAIRREIPRRGG